jgi:hypothetical protein
MIPLGEAAARLMATRTQMQTRTRAFVYQASAVELTKRGSRNSLKIFVRRGEKLLGTLALGRGSVEWRPEGHRVNWFRKSWTEFAAILDREMKR